MKKCLVVLLVLSISAVAWAEFEAADYALVNTNDERTHAAKEVQAEFKGLFDDWASRKIRILKYQALLGSGDSIVTTNYIETVTALFNSVNTGMNNLKTSNDCYISGNCEVE